jgi:hypothetical protein
MSIGPVIERLEATDWASLDAGGLASAMRDLARVKGFVAAAEHSAACRAGELAADGSGAPVEDLLGRATRCSRREAQRTARRAEALRSFPAIADLMAKGRIGVEHADAIARAADRLDEQDRPSLLALDAELAVRAASSTPDEFARHVNRIADLLAADRGVERAQRQRRQTRLAKGIDEATGMYWLRGEFDPETGARLFRAIDAETAALAKQARDGGRVDRSQLAAQALVGLATTPTRSRRPGRAELLVLVDLATIIDGLHAHSICELDDGTLLPVATLRRLACEADIIPVVLGGDGVALDVGRSRRLATADQRRALRAMYRSCGIDGCDVPFDRCEIHHLDEWNARDGETNLDRLIPACSHHHHCAHEGGWTLELDSTTRELTVTLPDGTLHSRSRPHSVAASTAGRAA